MSGIQTEIKLTEKKSGLFSNYIVRDLTLWFIFIFILPIILFIVYVVSKDSFETNLTKTESDSIEEPMTRVLLNKYSGSICNDGSTASYYIRLSKSNKNWIVFLDGGYFCHDKLSCSQRLVNSFNLTSSYGSKEYKFGEGILSSNPSINKYWSDANVVNIPYCSSDLWTGNKKCSNCSEEFNFMGSQIINDVFDDLIENTRIKESRQVLLTGISAGGIGVLMNAEMIKQKFEDTQVEFKIIIDSSWQLDLPYSYLCNENECPIHRIFSNSIKYWNSQIPKECRQNESKKIWNCFLPSKMIPFIKLPVFIIQSKFDETQLLDLFNQIEVRQPSNGLNLAKTFRVMDTKLKDSLKDTDSYFVTPCVNHMILSRDDWKQFKVNEFSLPEIVYKWTEGEGDIKLMDKCMFPDCFGTCPTMRHPDTNRVINPFDYLSYLGLINHKKLSHYLKLSEAFLKKLSYFKLMKLVMS